MLGRLAHKTADGLSSLKQHALDGSAQVKQHAAATYYRAVDPTPLAAARPGTVAKPGPYIYEVYEKTLKRLWP
ncbi:MAG TPA: hypothetical protein VE127_02830 [Solirubrobacteraceae bacterium]|nr:hypothetical protein [Solirubrobacteraceae bacterium]